MPCENNARERSVTVAFRVSPEMRDRLDVIVAASGMAKQDYIVARLMDETITVEPSTHVFKALRAALVRIYDQLCRLSAGVAPKADTVALIDYLAREVVGFKPQGYKLGEREHDTTANNIDKERESIFDLQR